MWEKIRTIWAIPELRRKIGLTLLLLAVYRLGYWVPLPIVDAAALKAQMQGAGGIGDFLRQVAIFSASPLSQSTIFGLGIMPYISASIIFQLLSSVWTPLERLRKEGETGQKKINEYTRYATVLICFGQSWFYVKWLASFRGANALVLPQFVNEQTGDITFWWQFVAVMIMTAGTVFLMWLGEQIDEYGIGNGISLLIMAGILADMPSAGYQLLSPMFAPGGAGLSLGQGSGGSIGVDRLLILILLFVAVVCGVVFMTQGERRIPTQSAKHVRGRRVFGGGRQYLPLKINQAGVMPIIFASSLLMFPWLAFQQLSGQAQIFKNLSDMFQRGTGFTYNILYVALIFFFCYFWTAIIFNPKDMSNTLKDYGNFIPGYRPGKRTADYLERVMVRITYVGAAFLALVAVAPTLVSGAIDIPMQVASFYGGTGLLIAVSVAFDLVRKIDSHLVMRNYRGLLDK